MPAMEESSFEEEDVCCNWREEEEKIDEGKTKIDEEKSDGNVANDDNNVNDNNDANLVLILITLEEINMMQVKHSKEQLASRSIDVSGNKKN